jgi:hypothetical protein
MGGVGYGLQRAPVDRHTSMCCCRWVWRADGTVRSWHVAAAAASSTRHGGLPVAAVLILGFDRF